MFQTVAAKPSDSQRGIAAVDLKPSRPDGPQSNVMVMPLARGLAVLGAFGAEQPWLGNHEIAFETGIPAPTVSRMLHSLVVLGYLHYDETRKKYRLTAAALSLGYAAIADADTQRLARIEMQKLAEASDSYVVLGTRDRLDVVVMGSSARHPELDLRLTAGARLHIASSPLGWALLAALPELERFYLLGNVERKTGRDWPSLRRRMAEGISQVRELGFCMSIGEWEPDLATIAAPVRIPDQPPLVLACIGLRARMVRARIEREIGPKMVATAQALQDKLAAHA